MINDLFFIAEVSRAMLAFMNEKKNGIIRVC